MPSSVKNKLVSKNNIDQLDDVDSMIDDFLFDDDDDEYFTSVSNETCISCSSISSSEYTQFSATTNNEDIPNKNNENTTKTIYSNIVFYLSFFDFTKYFK